MGHDKRQCEKIIPYRDRLLYLAKLIYEETDKENPMTMEEICDILHRKFGRDATKKTISEDILAINQHLFPVGCFIQQNNAYGYYKA